jgi:hypothetical protein
MSTTIPKQNEKFTKIQIEIWFDELNQIFTYCKTHEKKHDFLYEFNYKVISKLMSESL